MKAPRLVAGFCVVVLSIAAASPALGLASRVQLKNRTREGLAGSEDVVAGIGVVARVLGDEDAVGQAQGGSGASPPETIGPEIRIER